MKHRLFNKIYAKTMGYFWIPCPLCGRMFGGHEWLNGNILKVSLNRGVTVCLDCGKKAKAYNKANFGLTITEIKPTKA